MPRTSRSSTVPASTKVMAILRLPLVRGTCIGLFAAVGAMWLSQHPFLKAMDQWAVDTYFVLRGTRPYECPVTIVAMDKDTLDELDKPMVSISPELATVIGHLSDNGAAAIGVDIFLDPDLEDHESIGDAAEVGRKVMESQKVVLPAVTDSDDAAERDGVQTAQLVCPVRQWCEVKRVVAPAWTDFAIVDLSLDDDDILRSYTEFETTPVAAPLPPSESDAAVEDRSAPIDCQCSATATFPLCLVALARGLDREQLIQRIPGFEGLSTPINFFGPRGTIDIVRFIDVLNDAENAPAADANRWQGRIVIIGATDERLGDMHETPFSNRSVASEIGLLGAAVSAERMSGPEIHANIVAMIDDGSFLATLSSRMTIVWVAITGILLGALMVQFGIEMSVLLAVAHHIGWRVIAYWSFTEGDLILPVIPILLCGALTFTVTFALRWRFIRRTMGLFKSEAVARELEMHPSHLSRYGESREVTVLFADIRNFTSFSETHSPDEVVRLLNAYFAQVVPVIEQEGGILNQYLGDGMMAIFGSPVRQEDHATRAVRAAIEILRRVHAHSEAWTRLGAPEFRIGIGICTGPTIVGTIGSPRRLDYTAIGDTVNTAARIEAATKDLAAEILVSQSTYSQLRAGELNGAFGDPIVHHVKGKQEAVTVIEVTPR